MKASETKIQSIIEGTKQYVVPLFQRPYSWNKKEWEMLWEDLIWLYENDEPKNHFVGSIVTMPTESVPEGVTKYLLIDGQQRLTTILILLAAIRNQAIENDVPELAQEIEQTMLVNPFKRGNDYLKVLPTQIDRQSFLGLIQGTAVIEDAESPIMRCYQFFDRKLRQIQIGLSQLVKIITTRLSVVSILLDYDDNPYLVFESLNAKGRPLTQSDLIRNYFFMQIHVDEQAEINTKYWEPMQSALGDHLTESIRHYLMMRNGAAIKQSDVYFTLKDRIGQRINALTALIDIARFASYYQHFIFPETEPDPQLRAALIRLNRLEVTTVYPFLLNYYDDYAQHRISVQTLLTIIQLVENYVIRRFVCNIPTSQFNKIFPPLYKQASDKNPTNLIDGVRAILQMRGYPKNAEFQRQLIDSKLYGAGERGAKTRLILESLEAAYAHKEPVIFDALTVEHIMPQTLTDVWRRELGENWQADHELYLHTLGNLTLTGYNPELSNAPFQKKKAYLENSHLELNQYFRPVESWTRAEIEKRSQVLVEVALYVWPYFGEANSETPAKTDNVTRRVPTSLTILGQTHAVNSWRDVQAQTLNTIAALEPELFIKLAYEYPRFINPDADVFRRQRQLNNGFYMEVNLSAKDIYRFCTQAMETIGLSSEDWIVETRSA